MPPKACTLTISPVMSFSALSCGTRPSSPGWARSSASGSWLINVYHKLYALCEWACISSNLPPELSSVLHKGKYCILILIVGIYCRGRGEAVGKQNKIKMLAPTTPQPIMQEFRHPYYFSHPCEQGLPNYAHFFLTMLFQQCFYYATVM